VQSVRIRRTHIIRVLLSLICLCSLALFTGGCLSDASPEPSRTPSSPQPTSPATQAVPLQSPAAAPTPTTELETLVVWVTELVYPLQDSRQADVFAQQIAAFKATHPGLTVEVHRKKPDGKGGMLDFLLTASRVAPAVMPDLIAIDTAFLKEFTSHGLLVPIDALVSPEIQEDLYPFARNACTWEDQLVCLQFEIEDIEHAIYNPSKIAVAPTSWSEVFSSGATYIFPAAGNNGLVNDAFLIQYLSTGAQLVDANGDPALDPRAVADVLDFYQQGIARGAILPDVLEYATVENCWPKYLQAEVVMSNISSNLYLTVQGGEPASVPTRDGRAVMLSRGYAWALTARDAARQELAIKLLEWFMYPANMAAWSRAAGRLPTRRAAFEQMPRDSYVAFLYTQLEYAIPYPRSEVHERIYRAIQGAIEAVLVQGQSPESATQNLLKEIGQEAVP